MNVDLCTVVNHRLQFTLLQAGENDGDDADNSAIDGEPSEIGTFHKADHPFASKKTGKITVKKGPKKKTYKLKVRIKAAGTGNYKAKTSTVTVNIRVR